MEVMYFQVLLTLVRIQPDHRFVSPDPSLKKQKRSTSPSLAVARSDLCYIIISHFLKFLSY